MLLFETMLMGGKGVLTTLTLVGNTSTNTTSIAYPSGSAAGDIAFYFDKIEATIGSSVLPTGYTSIVSNSITNAISSRAAYKILTSSDLSANVTGSIPQTSNDSKYLLVLRPDVIVSNVTIGDIASEATSSTPLTQTLNMSGQQAPIVGFYQFSATTGLTVSTIPTGFTQITASGNENYIYYRIYNLIDTPADATGRQNDNGTNVQQSFYAQFSV